MNSIKKSIFVFLSFWISVYSFSQQNIQDSSKNTIRQNILSTENSSWTSVLSGKAVCAPKKTSYGFVVLTDGKMISACTDSGVKLWERGIPGKPEPYLTVFSKDFILTVSDKKNLSLINPSGLNLWTVEVPFEITEEPFVGRDSRIFVRGKKSVACFGINGICKWILETSALRNIPLLEMNDGSVLAVLEATENGKSSGLRFSPFGEILENITFKGQIQSAKSCSDGILLSFYGGGAGMCAVKDGKTFTKWTIPYSDRAFSNTNASGGSSFLALSNHRGALLISGSGAVKTRVLVFSTQDGHVSDWFNIDCYFDEIACSAVTNDSESIFTCGKTQAFVNSTNGDLLWSALLPKNPDIFSRWNFISFTQGNYLVICSSSWAMAAFRTTYRLTKKNRTKEKKLNYDNFYKIDKSYFFMNDMLESIDSRYTGSNRQFALKKGGYGKKEIEYVSALLSVCDDYSSFLSSENSRKVGAQKSIYRRDQTGMHEIFAQISLLGTDSFPPYIAKFIRLEKDETNFQSILKNISTFGYDPEGMILDAIEIRTKSILTSKTAEFKLVCDAVYEICRFMGRPALYEHGMKILTDLLYPQYNSAVKDYARNTLTKIAGLKI